MQIQIDTVARTPISSAIFGSAKRIAEAAALTAAVTVLGTILVPVLAIATALAWPFLPLAVALAGRERRAK